MSPSTLKPQKSEQGAEGSLKKFAETMGESNYEEQKKFFKKFKRGTYGYSRLPRPLPHLTGRLRLHAGDGEAAIRLGFQEICFTDHVEPIRLGSTEPRGPMTGIP